jgi:hypothetical protein
MYGQSSFGYRIHFFGRAVYPYTYVIKTKKPVVFLPRGFKEMIFLGRVAGVCARQTSHAHPIDYSIGRIPRRRA